MAYKSYRFIVSAALLVLVTGCATPNTQTADVRMISVYKQKTLGELGSFDFEKRMYICETINDLAIQLNRSPVGTTLKKSGARQVFKDFPALELGDRDLDGKAEQFAYLPEKGENTQEFGFIFDLNRDGNVDYIVFNGGIGFTKDFKKFIWNNYHWIDSNYDGKIDIFVYNNNISLDDDSFPDEGITGWVYDMDFDGFVDKAEYLGDSFQQPAEERNGIFIIKAFFGEKRWAKTDSFEFCDKILSDINFIMFHD
jgi:hypothetical protein